MVSVIGAVYVTQSDKLLKIDKESTIYHDPRRRPIGVAYTLSLKVMVRKTNERSWVPRLPRLPLVRALTELLGISSGSQWLTDYRSRCPEVIPALGLPRLPR